MKISNDLGLSKLTYLCELLHQKNVSSAAKKCFLTQSAMSHVLKEFRCLFNDPLLVKIGNHMESTPFARQLYTTLYPTLCEIKGYLTQHIQFDPKQFKRTFNLTGLDYIELMTAPHILKSLTPWSDAISIQFLPQEYSSITKALAHDIDFLITYTPTPPKELQYIELFKEEFICIARKNHPVIQDELTLETFLQASHIQVSDRAGSYYFVKERLKELGYERHIGYSSPNFLAMPQIVSETDLIITISKSLMSHFFKHLNLDHYQLPFNMPHISLKLCWHPLKEHDPEHQWFKSHLISIFKTFNKDDSQNNL